MSDLINGRTAEEIKSGLQCHVRYGNCDTECPYEDVHNEPRHECIQNMTKDALAYIQHLEAVQAKWISVKERLPEKDGDYLALIDLHQKPTDYTLSQPWFVARVYYRKKVGFHWHSGTVTHWMALPEAPEDDTNDA